MSFKVSSKHPIQKTRVFYSARSEDWAKRKWVETQVTSEGTGRYQATLTLESNTDVDWFAVVTDDRPVSVSSPLIRAKVK